ncbi:PAS domain-containing protein [Rhodoferax sp. 4810]|nr:PAS domain-containing protein [Rhodoferax jenense]
MNTTVDIFNCESEPIRFPGAVQPHGALLVLDGQTHLVEAASESCQSILAISPAAMLGQHVTEFLPAGAVQALLTDQDDKLWPLVPLSINSQPWTARSHRNTGGQWLIDIEPPRDGSVPEQMHYLCRRTIAHLRSLSDMGSIIHTAVQLVRGITGFDRVMIYQFDKDWNGEVIAEACVDHIEPYLGLHFPASDIPAQARELFKSSRLRQISDAAYQPSALIARGDGRAIDLGRSSLRSVSPIHIEYLENMGVSSTLVGSLVVEGVLWGLLSCQHKSGPRYFSAPERDTLGWFCEDLASLIQGRLIQQRRELELDLVVRRRRLVELIRQIDFRILIRQGRSRELLDVVNADGFALQIDDDIQVIGRTPNKQQIKHLQQRRREQPGSPALYSTHSIQKDLQVEQVDGGVAGALFVSVPGKPEVGMIWFRLEQVHTVRWSGNPDQAHVADASGRLSPRQSFALFLTTVSGSSLPWIPEELASASELGSLIEIELLRERDAFTQTILNSIPAHIAVLDHKGVISTVNEAWNRFAQEPDMERASLGVSYRDVSAAAEGRPSGDDAVAAWAGIEAVLNKELGNFTLDYRGDSSNKERWFRMNVYPLIGSGQGVVVAHDDITSRKLAEIQVERLLEEQASILSSDLVGIVKILDRKILWSNNAFNRMLGYAAGELSGRPMQQCYPSAEAFAAVSEQLFPAVQRGDTFRTELQLMRKNADIGWYAFHAGLLWAGGQEVIVMLIDITERKLAEEELATHRAEVQLGVSRQRLRELVVQNELNRERERKSVAREIHDELGQVLTGLRMSLLLMEMRFCSLDPALPKVVADMKALLDRGIGNVRDVVLFLRPAALDMGLKHALESLCNEFSKNAGLSFDLDLPKLDIAMDETRSIVVYRIVQESITNTIRHANASKVGVTLDDADELVLEIHDNGIGFDVEKARELKSFGLLGMRERAIALGGSLDIESSSARGTTVRLTIPRTTPTEVATP